MYFSELVLEDATADLLAKIRSALSSQQQAGTTTAPTSTTAPASTTTAPASTTTTPDTSRQLQLDVQGLSRAADEAVEARNRSELLRVLIDGPDATIIRALQGANIPAERHSLYIDRMRPQLQERLVDYLDRRYIQTSSVPGVRTPSGSWARRAQENMERFVDTLLRAVGA